MVHRIDVIMPPKSQYRVLHHFTRKLFEALQRNGMSCRLLEAKTRDPAPFLETLFEDPPECTLAFNGILPDAQGNFLCDMIKIPHLAYIVDSPNCFVPLISSPLSMIACVDRASVDFFKGLGFNKAIFVPHGVESTLEVDHSAHRDYDVVMLGSGSDYEAIRASWKEKYPFTLRQAMEEAIEHALADITIPYYQAFVQALDRFVSKQTGIDPQDIDFLAVLDEIERFIRSKDRIELLKNINEAKVDVFGFAEGHNDWSKYLGNQSNVTIHDPVPFEQALDIMKHTKILLNSCPWIHCGGHERIFSGFACGALVLANENVYLNQQFVDGESIVFYRPGHWDKANHRINEYLADAEKREKIVRKGRDLVMKFHTWDQRAQVLIQELPKLLEIVKT